MRAPWRSTSGRCCIAASRAPTAGPRSKRSGPCIRRFEPTGPREEALYSKLLDELQDLNDARRMRLVSAREGIPYLIWGVLIGGGVVTVLFTYFFGLKNFRAQIAMTALYVTSIGFVLFLIASIDHPFSGAVSVRPEAMELVIQRIEALEAARR